MQSIPAARDLSDKAQLQGEKTATQCPNGGCMFWTLGSAGALLIQLQIIDDDIKVAARLTLKHRMRRLPFEEQGHDEDRIDTAVSAVIEG